MAVFDGVRGEVEAFKGDGALGGDERLRFGGRYPNQKNNEKEASQEKERTDQKLLFERHDTECISPVVIRQRDNQARVGPGPGFTMPRIQTPILYGPTFGVAERAISIRRRGHSPARE